MLKNARKALGLTQAQMAVRYKTHPRTWQRWESGTTLAPHWLEPMLKIDLAGEGIDLETAHLDWTQEQIHEVYMLSGLKISAFAARCRVTRQLVDAWLRGKSQPTYKQRKILKQIKACHDKA